MVVRNRLDREKEDQQERGEDLILGWEYGKINPYNISNSNSAMHADCIHEQIT